MNHKILLENQQLRLDIPLFRLICFAMFNSWQMGFIFFMGPSLVMRSRTPLPISMDNITMLIALGYVLAIAYMICIPHLVVWGERISAICALITVLGLFLPVSEDILRLFVYAHVFFCCFMIGFESFIISNILTEKSAILHLTVAYSIAVTIIALVQNDTLPISFSFFQVLTILMLAMMLWFFFRLPATKASAPRFVCKEDGLTCPKKLFFSLYLLIIVSCLMMICGPSAVTEIRNGVSLAYLMDALAGLLVYAMYRWKHIHPLRFVPITMGLSVVGFLMLFASAYIPELTYIACALIGFGYMPCQLLPLYGLIMTKSYPSRYIVPSVMSLAVFTVVIQSSLVELFRNSPHMLYLAYLALMVILLAFYIQVAPYLINTMQRKIMPMDAEPPKKTVHPYADLLSQLTSREREVLELIGLGYSNTDISNILVISSHTVNDYTKKIYRKLNVHSRHAAAAIINQSE